MSGQLHGSNIYKTKISAVSHGKSVDKNRTSVDELHWNCKENGAPIYFPEIDFPVFIPIYLFTVKMSHIHPVVVCFTPFWNIWYRITLLYKLKRNLNGRSMDRSNCYLKSRWGISVVLSEMNITLMGNIQNFTLSWRKYTVLKMARSTP